MLIVINYGTDTFSPWTGKNYLEVQAAHTNHLKSMGVDKVINYSPAQLPTWFTEGYSHILSYSRGAGYWSWKPLIIHETLENYPDATVVYMDSDWYFLQSPSELTQHLPEEGLMVFEMPGGREKEWTKRDAFILLDCDSPMYAKTPQRTAGMSIWKRNDFTLSFCSEWLTYAKDARMITDEPSVLGPDCPQFVSHRHDQSIYSLMTKKAKLPVFRDPSQYGNEFTELFTKSPYGQVVQINHW